ncbi:cortexin-1 isoform X1 [Cuculus canorus]|uniref:cortexin-1 isoform X1 n=1 Tax=Cuculus canorus TaxID=55661 RepID=UPI0023AB45E6|nr:cortexin-1 isoform X1 [Cuculus canorus]XP_053906377.1 cortexin-1 isoform X1 [Cuculus canorus]
MKPRVHAGQNAAARCNGARHKSSPPRKASNCLQPAGTCRSPRTDAPCASEAQNDRGSTTALLYLQPKKAGSWRPFLSDVAVWTQPSPPSAAVAMLTSPWSCSEEVLAWAGANPQLGVAAPVPME